jgi:hypothetical protein
MDQFDLVGALRTFAESNSWVFLYGDGFMRNYKATKSTIKDGQLILGADPFIARPTYTQAGKIESITYSGLVMLGTKFDLDDDDKVVSKSSLDETLEQKYDRRLLVLMNMLSINLASFACDHELTISSTQFELEINKLDENIDFVVCSITLVQ